MNGTYPPGIDGPYFYLASVFALLLGMLLALEWLWRLAWSFVEAPASPKTPLTVLRGVFVILLGAAIIRMAPQLWLYMRWPALTPAGRTEIAAFGARADFTDVVLFTLAWLAFYLAGPMLTYQLRKEPLALHLWPAREQVKRPLKIGLGVFVIAFVLTFLR
jgi:hypothetical protein